MTRSIGATCTRLCSCARRLGVDELVTWLDEDILGQLWPDLYLPRGVRWAWELQHPELASLRDAA